MAILNDLLVNGISRFIGGVIMSATNVTSSTTYYPVLATGTSTSLFVDTNKSGLSFTKVDGTTGAEGTATLTLGNTTASGTAGNATGQLILRDYYGVGATIAPRAGGGRSNNTMMYLPNWSGSAEYLISSQSSSGVGSATQPVYVDSGGHVQAANANRWGFSSQGGVFYPYNASNTSNTFNAGSLTMLGNEVQGITGIKTGESAINILAENHQDLAASTNAGVTSYTMSGVQDIGAVSSTICAENIYYYSVDGLNALKPTSVSSDGRTLTFASTLNPNNAITVLSFANYDNQGRSILSGAGLTNTHTCNVLVGAKLYNSGYFNLNIGQLNYSGGQASFVVGARNYTNANYTLTAGFRNTNIKTGAFVSGQWHDTTNGPDYLAAVGQYSSITSTSAFVVGNGTAANARSNAFEVHTDGRATVGAAPTADMDVATKKYVDDNSGGGTITGGGISGYLAKWTGTGAMSHELTVGPMIGTGTTKFLREDGTWQVPAGGGTVENVAKTFSGTSSTAAATAVKVVDCSEFTASDLVMGTMIYVVFSVKNTAAVASVALDVNSTGSHLVRQLLRNGAQITLQDPGYLPASIPIPFYFDGTYWVALMNYDANTVTQVINRRLCTTSTAGSTYRYEIMLFDYRGYALPINNTSNAPTTYTKTLTTNTFDPFKGVMYYTGTTTISAGTSRDANEFASKYAFDVRYALNIRSDGTAGSTALSAGKPVYLKAKYNIDTKVAVLVPIAGNNYLDASSITQDLPTTNPDTALASNEKYIYILLGMAYSKYQLDMWQNKSVLAWNPIIGQCDNFTGAPFSGSGTFALMDSGAQYGVSGTYYKNGKTVTIYGSFPTGSTAITSLPGLPFAPANSFEVMLPQYSMSVLSIVQCKLGFTAGSTSVTTTGYTYGMSSSNNSWINYTGRAASPFMITYVTND